MNTDLNAWYEYLLARKKRLDAAWTEAKASYKSLRQVRADLHLQFIDAADPNAWTAELDQDAVDLQYGVLLLLSAADDVLAGRRKVGWDASRNEFFVERLPIDKIKIDTRAAPVDPITGVTRSGRNVLVTIDTGADTRMSGTVSGAITLGTGLSDLAFFSAFITAESEATRLGTIADQKTLGTLASYRQGMVTTGFTEEQSNLFAHAISDGAKGVYSENGTKIVLSHASTSSNGLLTGEKILLASVIVSVIGLAMKVWTEVFKKPEVSGGVAT